MHSAPKPCSQSCALFPSMCQDQEGDLGWGEDNGLGPAALWEKVTHIEDMCAPWAPVPALSPSWAHPDRLMPQATRGSPLLRHHPQALLVVLGKVKGAWPPPSSQEMLSRNFRRAMAHTLKGQFSFSGHQRGHAPRGRPARDGLS